MLFHTTDSIFTAMQLYVAMVTKGHHWHHLVYPQVNGDRDVSEQTLRAVELFWAYQVLTADNHVYTEHKHLFMSLIS